MDPSSKRLTLGESLRHDGRVMEHLPLESQKRKPKDRDEVARQREQVKEGPRQVEATSESH